jgi:hypothetical protein|tara:strand:- start:11977 stop:12201 length:225 start_codon:yes stop_codon:yes gene_type:complete
MSGKRVKQIRRLARKAQRGIVSKALDDEIHNSIDVRMRLSAYILSGGRINPDFAYLTFWIPLVLVVILVGAVVI